MKELLTILGLIVLCLAMLGVSSLIIELTFMEPDRIYPHVDTWEPHTWPERLHNWYYWERREPRC